MRHMGHVHPSNDVDWNVRIEEMETSRPAEASWDPESTIEMILQLHSELIRIQTSSISYRDFIPPFGTYSLRDPTDHPGDPAAGPVRSPSAVPARTAETCRRTSPNEVRCPP